ncbi:MAG TPA: hypothetical protein VMM81_01065, partial [Acidimicrobiia bacterium]|nr:hypothetical protein [Acidimicrobiia bacterium]
GAMNTLRGRLGALRQTDDAGIGVLGVIMFGATLSLITAMVMGRGAAQFGNAAADSCWEAALDSAESALNWGTAQVDADHSFATDTYVPASFVGTTDERTAAIDAADLAAETAVLQFPEGDGVFLRGAGSIVLYGVGYCDGRDDASRRVRVVRSILGSAQIVSMPWGASYAFLSGADLTISGDPEFGNTEVMGNNAASAHANGHMLVDGTVTFWTGCVTSSDGGVVGSNVNIFGFCPGPSDRFVQPPKEIPQIIPEDLWYLSEYDLCPGGTFRAGPAHPTLGDTAGAAPCTGHELATGSYRSFSHNSTTDGIASWTRGGNTKYDGSYYIHHGSVAIEGNAGSATDLWRVLVIASSSGECPNNLGGDISTSGGLRMGTYQPSTALEYNNLLLVAGRDITASGSGQILYSAAVIAAHEQILYSGTVTVEGSFVAQEACDTVGSPVSTSEVSGNAVIVTEGSLGSPFMAPTTIYGSLAEWTELR